MPRRVGRLTVDLARAIQPNEEESEERLNQQALAGRISTDEELKQARYTEHDRLEEYHAKFDVERSTEDGPLLTVTWVDEARGEREKSRVRCALARPT